MINQSETEFVDIIFKNLSYNDYKFIFKFKSNDKIETSLRIVKFENSHHFIIDYLTNEEISNRIIKSNNWDKKVNYFINLSKNKILINHYDYNGKL